MAQYKLSAVEIGIYYNIIIIPHCCWSDFIEWHKMLGSTIFNSKSLFFDNGVKKLFSSEFIFQLSNKITPKIFHMWKVKQKIESKLRDIEFGSPAIYKRYRQI